MSYLQAFPDICHLIVIFFNTGTLIAIGYSVDLIVGVDLRTDLSATADVANTTESNTNDAFFMAIN